MLLKRIISFVIACSCSALICPAAGQNFNKLSEYSSFRSGFGNQKFPSYSTYDSMPKIKQAPSVIPVDSITGIFSSVTTSISSVWSAIPTEIKIVGCFATVLSLPHLYSCFKRWWCPSEKKFEDKKEENKRHGDLIDDLERGILRKQERRGSFAELVPNSTAAEKFCRTSLQEPSLKQLLEEQGTGAIKLHGITPGDTPDVPTLNWSDSRQIACYQRVQNFLKKEIELGIVSSSWCSDLVYKTLGRIDQTYGDQLDISQCSEDILSSIFSDILCEASWFKQFRLKRNRVKVERFKRCAGTGTQDSIFSILSKADAVFVDFFGECSSYPAIVRVAVPEQRSAECGCWSLVNLFCMKQAIQNIPQANATNFYEASKKCFNQYFTNGPENQQVSDDYLDSKARLMEFKDYITLSVNHDVQDGQLPEVYIERLSTQIKEKLLDGRSVNILLQSTSRSEVGQHAQHWSAVSIVQTGDMQVPVILLMDSLKNSVELKTKPIVENALKQIAAEVVRAMNSQPIVW